MTLKVNDIITINYNSTYYDPHWVVTDECTVGDIVKVVKITKYPPSKRTNSPVEVILELFNFTKNKSFSMRGYPAYLEKHEENSLIYSLYS